MAALASTIHHARLAAVVEAIGDGVVVVSDDMSVCYMNPAALRIFGYPPDMAVPPRLDELLPAEYRSRHAGLVAAFRESEERSRPMQARNLVWGCRQDGSRFPAEISIAKLGDGAGMVAVVRDLSSREQMLADLALAASHDHLTAIYNRREAERLLTQEMARARRFGHPLAVVMFDLDHFKAVNDSYGHAVGDTMLRECSRSVSALLRSSDALARWGGEEFMAILPETDLDGATAWCERARSAIGAIRVPAASGQVKLTASFGATVFDPAADDTLAALAVRADSLMYRAKGSGRNRTVGALAGH